MLTHPPQPTSLLSFLSKVTAPLVGIKRLGGAQKYIKYVSSGTETRLLKQSQAILTLNSNLEATEIRIPPKQDIDLKCQQIMLQQEQEFVAKCPNNLN